jgi:DNA ligase-1
MIRKPFKERYELMKKLLKGIPFIQVVDQIQVKDFKHMDQIHKDLVKIGAEGTMIRDPESYYEHKRSKSLLKIKDFFDAEVIVDSYEFGEGRNKDVMGKLHVHWKDKNMGTTPFKVGSGFNDIQRANWEKLYPKGTVLTIKYWEIDKSSKKPRFPIFMHIKSKE